MDRSEQGKANRQYYLSRGRCPRCGGKHPVLEGRVLCEECQAKHDEEQIERRKRWKTEGKCTRCGSERGGDGVLCPKCKAYMTDIRHNNAQVCKDRRERFRMEANVHAAAYAMPSWAEAGAESAWTPTRRIPTAQINAQRRRSAGKRLSRRGCV